MSSKGPSKRLHHGKKEFLKLRDEQNSWATSQPIVSRKILLKSPSKLTENSLLIVQVCLSIKHTEITSLLPSPWPCTLLQQRTAAAGQGCADSWWKCWFPVPWAGDTMGTSLLKWGWADTTLPSCPPFLGTRHLCPVLPEVTLQPWLPKCHSRVKCKSRGKDSARQH